LGKFLTFSAPLCLDGAKTNQSTRFELVRCLGNKAGLVRVVRAPNCRFVSVFESPRPTGRVALLLPICLPTRPSREPQSKQKGNRARIPSPGPAGPTASVIVGAHHQKAASALKPAEQHFWQMGHFGEISDFFSSTLPRRRQDQPEHPVRACSVPWQQSWPGARRQSAKLPVCLRVRVPASNWACCALAPHLPPHQAKSRTTVETKGQPCQDPVSGTRGANRLRNCRCAPPEGGFSLETS
jgi:hypothetical protein